jgi:hypothetical protein
MFTLRKGVLRGENVSRETFSQVSPLRRARIVSRETIFPLPAHHWQIVSRETIFQVP